MAKWSFSLQKVALLIVLHLHGLRATSIRSSRRDEPETVCALDTEPPKVGIDRETANVIFEKPATEKYNYELVLLDPFTLKECQGLGRGQTFSANFSQVRRCTAMSNDGRYLWGMGTQLVRMTNPHCSPGGNVQNVAMEQMFCFGVEIEDKALLASPGFGTETRGCLKMPCTNTVSVTPDIKLIFWAPKYYGQLVEIAVQHSDRIMETVAEISIARISIVPSFLVPLEDKEIDIWPNTQRNDVEVRNARNMSFPLHYKDVQLNNYVVRVMVDIMFGDGSRRRLVKEQARTPVLTAEHMVKTFVKITWNNVTKRQYDEKLSLQLRAVLANCHEGLLLGINDVELYSATEVSHGAARRGIGAEGASEQRALVVEGTVTSPYPKAPTITTASFQRWLRFLSLPSNASIHVVRVEVTSPNRTSFPIDIFPPPQGPEAPRDRDQAPDDAQPSLMPNKPPRSPAVLSSTEGRALLAIAAALASLVSCLIICRRRRAAREAASKRQASVAFPTAEVKDDLSVDAKTIAAVPVGDDDSAQRQRRKGDDLEAGGRAELPRVWWSTRSTRCEPGSCRSTRE